jgi:hypothetical protein
LRAADPAEGVDLALDTGGVLVGECPGRAVPRLLQLTLSPADHRRLASQDLRERADQCCAIVTGNVFNATGRAADRVFSVTGLVLLGLTLLALHQAGIGSVWVRRRCRNENGTRSAS